MLTDLNRYDKREWIELPRQGEVLPEFGLKRGFLLKLCKSGLVMSVHLKSTPDAQRGKRLINVNSLREYVAKGGGPYTGGNYMRPYNKQAITQP